MLNIAKTCHFFQQALKDLECEAPTKGLSEHLFGLGFERHTLCVMVKTESVQFPALSVNKLSDLGKDYVTTLTFSFFIYKMGKN